MKLTTSALNLMGWMVEQTDYYGSPFTSADMAYAISTPFELKQLQNCGYLTLAEKTSVVPEHYARHNPTAARHYIVEGFMLTEKGICIGAIGRKMRVEAREADHEDITSPMILADIAKRHIIEAGAMQQQVAA